MSDKDTSEHLQTENSSDEDNNENLTQQNSSDASDIVQENEQNSFGPIQALQESEHPAVQVRKKALINIKKQANKMLLRCKSRNDASVGDRVAVSVSEYDRGRGDPANVIGIILEVDEHKRYRIGTRAGIISNWMERNTFEIIKFRGIEKSDVPETEKSLREITRTLSVGHGQGFKKCTCKGGCNSKRCKFVKNNIKCNSSCHGRRSCQNHDN